MSEYERMVEDLKPYLPKLSLSASMKTEIYNGLRYRIFMDRGRRERFRRIVTTGLVSFLAVTTFASTAVAAIHVWNVVFQPDIVPATNGGFVSSLEFSGPYKGLYPYGKEAPTNGYFGKTKDLEVIEQHFGVQIPVVADPNFKVHDVGGQTYANNPSHLFIQVSGTLPTHPNIIELFEIKDLTHTLLVNGTAIRATDSEPVRIDGQQGKYMHFPLTDGHSFDYLVWTNGDWTLVVQTQDTTKSTLVQFAKSIKM